MGTYLPSLFFLSRRSGVWISNAKSTFSDFFSMALSNCRQAGRQAASAQTSSYAYEFSSSRTLYTQINIYLKYLKR